MIISDLSYLETAEADVLGAGSFSTTFNKNGRINVAINVKINKNIDVRSNVKGRSAFAEASADASGNNAFSETETFAAVGSDYAASFSSSTASSN